MSNIFRATKYQLMTFKTASFICLSVIAFNILISITVTYLFPGSGVLAGSSDLVAFIFIFIIGIVAFMASFKFMLANAVSRKSLFWANILSMAIASIAWAVIITLILSIISRMNIKIFVLYTIFYNNYSVMASVVWFITVFYLLIVSGWFISMAYYRSSKRMSFLISFAPFVLSGLLTIINQSTNGKLFESIIKFIVAAMGFSGSIPNPYIASFSMLLCTVIICGFNYLLIRKAEIKA
ncbi:hypothetical protein [Clostridium sp.]|uniref:hypothetical protein n=1 Tax=Clostridium sp. TaxID=1506 RepID=UPI001A4A8A68|nr:hypothetical protein [Clostridium sp.]MBK5240689.1 hypothetical protein [Clostridium sp.]